MNEIQKLISELKSENDERNKRLSIRPISDRAHTVLVHEYNLTLDFIKRLETIKQ